MVAALTLPTLIQNYQKKQTVTKLRKAITVLNQASRLSYNDVGSVSETEIHNMTTNEYFEKYWQPYFQNIKICTDYAICGYKSNSPFYTLKGDVAGYSFINPETRVAFYSKDGMMYEIFVKYTNPDLSNLLLNLIVVDINGSKEPNVLGKDVFSFERTEDGFVNPKGSNLTDEEINNSCSLTNPAPHASTSYCAEKIRRDGWEISDDYPW